MMTLKQMENQVVEAIVPFAKEKAIIKPETVELYRFDHELGCWTFRGKDKEGTVVNLFRVYPYHMSVYEVHKEDRDTEWHIGELI